MRLPDINRLQARRQERGDGERCFFVVLHYISAPDAQQGLSPPAFPPREYGPEAGSTQCTVSQIPWHSSAAAGGRAPGGVCRGTRGTRGGGGERGRGGA